tara:strand:+ start:1214 stop:1954 length:741 start_codon:yes stop_codon:yes gene_type:complete
MFDFNKLEKNGYIKIKKIIPISLIKNFKKEILSIEKQFQNQTGLKNRNFLNFYSQISSRSRIYTLMQNLVSIRKISNFIDSYLEKNNFFKKCQFINRSVNNGLIISLPKENKHLSPPHQDIYSFKSKLFLKAWIPLTKVDEINGSMKVYKGSHLKGFAKPAFKNSKSIFPSIKSEHYNQCESEIFKLVPSDVVIFNPFIIHQSIPNKSSKIRFTTATEFHGIRFLEDEELIKEFNLIKEIRTNRRK